MLDEINPAAAIMGVIGGLIGVIVSGSMMPSIFMKIIVFAACTFLGYIVCDKIFNQ